MMVAGRVPFEAETATDVLSAITRTEPPPLARYSPKVPAEFEWIVMKALRKDVDERYQTARELYSDLKKLKQRLEFESELERSVPPDRLSAIVSNAGDSEAAAILPTQLTGQAQTAEGTRTTAVDSATVPRPSSAEFIVTEIKRHKAVSLAIALVVVAAVAVSTYFFRNRAAALTEKDTILLADFVNTTGETVFDGTLKQALAVQLGQSPFLNIFPEDRVRESLRFMGRSPDDRITRDVAREICERQGIKAMLVGSISGLGSHYVVTIEAVNAHTGDSIAREQVEAESKEKVLASLGNAASSLRSKLGESLSSIKKFEVPVEQATTSSLEALKAYAMATEERGKGNSMQALALYKRATELDPNFAMAYARIAVGYGNMEQLNLAQEYVQRAFALRDRVSERERLYISEKYYNYVTGEIDKSMEVLQTWARLYPNDFIPRNNLALNSMYLGRYEDALRHSLEAVRLGPNVYSAHDNLISSFFHLGRFDEADKANGEMAALFPDAPNIHFNNYSSAFLRRDEAAMQREAEWARGKPVEAEFLGMTAARVLSTGHLKQAEEIIRRQLNFYATSERKENASQTLTYLAFNQALLGKCEPVAGNVKKGLALGRGRISLPTSAMALVLCKDTAQAQQLLDEMLKVYPKDTAVSLMSAPPLRAEIERQRGNLPEALQLFESARQYDFGLIAGIGTPYLRGQAYLQQRAGKEAAVEFQSIISRPGVDSFSPLHVLAHLGLARASVLTGDTSKARTEYQDFFALWKDADQDLPVLLQAKKEYAALQ